MVYNIFALAVNFEFTHIELINLRFTNYKLDHRLRVNRWHTHPSLVGLAKPTFRKQLESANGKFQA